jgi:hypothetical protein
MARWAVLLSAALAAAGCCEGFIMEGTARADRQQWRYSSLTVLPFEMDPSRFAGDVTRGQEYLQGIRNQLVDEVTDGPPAGPAPLWLRGRAVAFVEPSRGLFAAFGSQKQHITLEIAFIDMYGRVLAQGTMTSDTLYGDKWDFGCTPQRRLALGAADFFHKHFTKI